MSRRARRRGTHADVLTHTCRGVVRAARVFYRRMAYMNCPRCGLSVRLRAAFLTLERCPRCLAKAGISVPMQITESRRRHRPSQSPTDDGRPAGEPSDETLVGLLVIRTERDAHALVLTLSGELDLASAPALERQLDDARDTAIPRVVVDLSGLEFFDSAGLHVLLNAHRRLRGNGQGLVLRPGRRAVQRMFELTNTLSIFRFED
jgi:anti-sigma B factor antagonist